jgi:hypothetical protein
MKIKKALLKQINSFPAEAGPTGVRVAFSREEAGPVALKTVAAA